MKMITDSLNLLQDPWKLMASIGENTVGIQKNRIPTGELSCLARNASDRLLDLSSKIALVEEAMIGSLVSEASKNRLIEKATARIDTLSRGYRQRVASLRLFYISLIY